MKTWLKILALSSVAVALAACNTNKANQPGANDQAQAYKMGQKGGLQGSDVNGGQTGTRYVNPLTAPARQVYYFEFDNSAVSAADTKAATIQAAYLVSHRNAKVRLEGNTDDVGSREYNIGLGWRRAQAVARILKQQGVSSQQISMVSYGKERPAVNGTDEQARSLNRRVELTYVQQ